MQQVRAAIIGCGNVAHIHAKALQNIKESELVAVHSRSQERAAVFAGQYGARAFTSVSDMIATAKVDVVIICTAHPDHRSPAVEALNAGAHVLVEKPLASSLEDCDAMIQAATRNNRKLGVVSQRRFYAPCQRMKEAIDAGKIGRPMIGSVVMLGWRDQKYYESAAWRGTWDAEGGGVLVNQAPHQLDLFHWFMGDSIDEVYGVWKNINHPYIEVEDTALAIVKFRNGAIGNIMVSNSQKPGIHGKVHIHGGNGASVGTQTEGGAMFIAGMSSILEPPYIDIWTVPDEENKKEIWRQEDEAFFKTIDAVEYYIRQQDRDFILAVLNNREPLVTAMDGRRTVQLFTAIYQSSKENRPVTINN